MDKIVQNPETGERYIATKPADWSAKRLACERRLPCPMPASHIMFREGSRYFEVQS